MKIRAKLTREWLMMNYVNQYLRGLKPYPLASQKIWTVDESRRKEILKLDWNESTLPPSPKVGERLRSLIEESNTIFNYYPSTNNEELLNLLSDYVGLKETNIQYFGGSDSLQEYIGKLYVTVGDRVLLLGPTYDNFRLTAEVCGAKVSYHLLDEPFLFDLDLFEKDLWKVQPSLVYICNPNNPTGTVIHPERIEMLLDKFPETLFVIDEAYVEFSGMSCKDLVTKHENILVTRTLSKAFALANFRVGYLIASESNIKSITKIRNPKNISTFSQEAAVAALGDVDYMKAYVQEVESAKKIFCETLSEYSESVRCIAGGGNFVLLLFEQPQRKADIVSGLAAKNIFVRGLSQTPFLASRGVRITVGTRAQMETVADKIIRLLDGAAE